MIKFDSETMYCELELPGGEAQFMREVSSIIALLRDKLYEGGHSEAEVDNMCFGAFKIAMENTDAFPYSPEALAAKNKLRTEKRRFN